MFVSVAIAAVWTENWPAASSHARPSNPRLAKKSLDLSRFFTDRFTKIFLPPFSLLETGIGFNVCQQQKLSYETFRSVLNELAEPSGYTAGAASTKPATIFRRPSGAITAKSVPPRYNGASGIPPAAQLNLM